MRALHVNGGRTGNRFIRHGAVGLLLALAACVPAGGPVPVSDIAPVAHGLAPGDALVIPQGYQLVWQDDFAAGDRPDPRNWNYETNRNRKGWFNEELQYYARDRRENARVEGGRLVIEAHAGALDPVAFPDSGGQRFNSARLTTRGKRAWRHGFFRVRAKLPCVRGAWPAIWLLPEYHDVRWQGGEIDIAETVGYEPDTVHHAVQTAERNFTRGNQAENATRADYCNTFHDYELLWTPDQVAIGMDGNVGFVTPAAAFDRKMALILNVAVGGAWAGAKVIDEGAFPARMEVGSISVWQGERKR